MDNLKDELFSVTESNNSRKDNLYTEVDPNRLKRILDTNLLPGISTYELNSILDYSILDTLRESSLRALALPDEFISKYFTKE